MIRNWLEIKPAGDTTISINETLDFNANAFINRVWYRGDSNELSQVYKQLMLDNYSFWQSVPTTGFEIRKIHTGIPKAIVNSLSSLTLSDMNRIYSEDIEELEDILEENKFDSLLQDAVKKALYLGDGAFKISIDSALSKYPIIEFYEADRVELEHKRGRLHEVIFNTKFEERKKKYVLREIYGYGYIHYELYDSDNNAIELTSVERFAELVNVEFDKKLMMATPFKIFNSDKHVGRGQSIFDSKRDNFDALDEVWSQWMDALRAGRTKTYIPESLIPRNINTGQLMRSNSFDNRFIATQTSMKENAQDVINTVQPNIPTENYLQTYITALDLCLQGIISPSTLGIDTKKLDNAEAQREKEKATLYTRNAIVQSIQKYLPDLLKSVCWSYLIATNRSIKEIEVEISFGEYANPSFESQVETVGKAKTQGIMSIEACIEELYGDTKDEEWKAEEVARIKGEQGIMSLDTMPALNNDGVPIALPDEDMN